ncbi:MAG: hypothetical protein SFY56_01755 [Bacteroidota bacterium]|nr:hypothetical protein [Bacteroidota bacterium]
MAKHSVHIGKKIKEILQKTPISVVDFAKSINLTRNGAYKVFEKETIDTGQLQTISKVLNHDFFVYYDSPSSKVKENEALYGYATKAEVYEITHTLNELSKAILTLSKEIEIMQKKLPNKKVKDKK